jgi:hypothetical protein
MTHGESRADAIVTKKDAETYVYGLCAGELLAERKRIKAIIGHSIPDEGSQTLVEDLEMMSGAAKRAGDGLILLVLAENSIPSVK